jgi:hypothetical protein
MEILDLKFAGITLWTWLPIIAAFWLLWRHGDRVLGFLSAVFTTAIGLAGVAFLVLIVIGTIVGIPQAIYDGDWSTLLLLLVLPAFWLMAVALGKLKHQMDTWYIRREPPAA